MARPASSALLILLVTLAFSSPTASAQEPVDVTFRAYPCGLACGLDSQGNFDVCASPLMSLGYDQVAVTIPEGMGTLSFDLFPPIDWDAFLCGPDGELIVASANLITTCQVSCPEHFSAAVEPGNTYVIRGFNFADPFIEARGSYTLEP